MLIIGFIVTGFGVAMTVHVSFVGVEPWSAVNIGLSEKTLTYGTWNMIIQMFFILLTFVIEKRLPRFGTFLNMAVVSIVIDFFIYIDKFPEINGTLMSYIFFIMGVIISNIGISIVIVTNLGSGAKTQFYVVIHEKTKIKLEYLKYGMEILGLTLAFLVGGPIFIGTILFVFISGFVIGKTVPFLKKVTGWM